MAITTLLYADDIQLVKRQCEIQQATSPEEIEGFASAYLLAKQYALRFWPKDKSTADVIEFVHELAGMIDPRNKNGYRLVLVSFKNGGESVPPRTIAWAMSGWARGYFDGLVPSVQLYKEFELIHPFIDGNGRIGDLLWKISVTRDSGLWPMTLPPNLFAGD